MSQWITFAFDGDMRSQPLGGPYASLDACKADHNRIVEETCKADGKAWFFDYRSYAFADGMRTRFGNRTDADSVLPQFRQKETSNA